MADTNTEWQEAYETLREILQVDDIPPYPPPNSDSSQQAPPPSDDPAHQAATALASYIPFLSPAALLPPRMPDHKEMDAVILALHKKRLEEEMLG